jgi:hypothetical protein
MGYYMEGICKMDTNKIERYDIYKLYGFGVVEAPYRDGETVRTLECSEFDAWIISESMNIMLYGVISKRSSWEEPVFSYKKSVNGYDIKFLDKPVPIECVGELIMNG